MTMEELMVDTVESSELVEETFNFWFTDQGHIRTPFPTYIRPALKEQATASFYNWTANLDSKAKDDVNDEIIAEKFEEIIFEKALELVKTEDEKITIQYPFLPRLGDEINPTGEDGTETVKSKVIDRNMKKEGDHSFLQVKLEKPSKELWETQFELPL